MPEDPQRKYIQWASPDTVGEETPEVVGGEAGPAMDGGRAGQRRLEAPCRSDGPPIRVLQGEEYVNYVYVCQLIFRYVILLH